MIDEVYLDKKAQIILLVGWLGIFLNVFTPWGAAVTAFCVGYLVGFSLIGPYAIRVILRYRDRKVTENG